MRAVFLLPFLIGCGSSYRMVVHAEPSPFTRPGCRLVVEQLHTAELVVGDKPVAQYVGEKSGASADSFDADLRAADQILHERLGLDWGALFVPGGTPDNTFVMRPVFVHWEPGFYAVFASGAGRANLMFDVLSPTGQVLDRFAVEKRANDFSSGGRMRTVFKHVGAAASDYLRDNWLCAQHSQ
jgi:hypothetical protein